MQYKVNIFTSGLSLTLPHNDAAVRTPCEFTIEKDDLKEIENMIRFKNISNYKIVPLNSDEGD